MGRGIKKQPPTLLLLTPSIDNGFAVPLRNRDEERGDSSQYRGCLSIRQWFRAKLTITEPQMEPQREEGEYHLLLPEAVAISGLQEGLKLSGREGCSRVFMAGVQKIKLVGTED